MKTYRIENITSGFVLGVYYAKDEQHALELCAKEAGYKSVKDIPNLNRDELDIQQLTETEERSFAAGMDSVFQDAENNGEGIFEPKN